MSHGVHHDIHPAELGPHLQTHSQEDTLRNARLHELLVTSRVLLALQSQRILDLLVLSKDLRVVDITIPMETGKVMHALIPAVLTRQPTRRLGVEEQPHEVDSTRDNLDTPGDAESRRALGFIFRAAVDVAGAVLDEVLDQDTPGDCPLLQRDHAASDLLRADFGDVDRDHGGGDADTEACDDTADDKKRDAVGGALEA